MDREQELIDAVTTLVKIISGLQDTVANQTKCIELLKERLEKAEEKIEYLYE